MNKICESWPATSRYHSENARRGKDEEKELRTSLLSYASRSLRRQEYQYVMSGGASVIAKGQVRRPSRGVPVPRDEDRKTLSGSAPFLERKICFETTTICRVLRPPLTHQ
jgi:hypothetical protein